MGGTISRILGFNRYRVLLIGLENSGKTSILYNLKFGVGKAEIVKMPTSVNVENIDFQEKILDFWEIGGSSRVRPLWSQYYPKMNFIIFVIDSTDNNDKLEDAKLQLWRVLEEPELENSKFLVFLNKIDQIEALEIDKIEEKLNLSQERFKNRKIKTQKCSGITQEGVADGLNWLIN